MMLYAFFSKAQEIMFVTFYQFNKLKVKMVKLVNIFFVLLYMNIMQNQRRNKNYTN